MSVRVQLDLPHGDIYTNLDFVSGRVLLTLPTDTTISAITVKLEGESKTRLEGTRSVPGAYDREKSKTLLEVHKLLYKVETVFPGPELRQPTLYNTNRTSQYTLLRGQYEYPFKFKIPFNSDCIENTSIIKDLKVGALSVQYGQEPTHAKLPLPPSLGGLPGEAEIKYYVKATVVRPKFYQENIRNEVAITFLPIEPPKPADAEGETYGRRRHQFQRTNTGPSRKTSLFKSSSKPAVIEEEPPSFQVDARLPNPAVLTCRQGLPLRIIIERLNSSTASLFLSMLQIELIGHTKVRAYDLNRTESHPWLLVSLANMAEPLEHSSNKKNQWIVPSHFWDKLRLPATVAPTFSTCNISRTYELEVRVGLTHGMADGIRPEIIVSPIRLIVLVYSGIHPPPQLLHAISMRSQGQQRPARIGSMSKIDTKQNASGSESTYSTPITSSNQYAAPSGRPPSAGVLTAEPASFPHVINDDLPPSYEDAIASELAPVDGPRPTEYTANGDSSPQAPAFNPDSKSSLGRRVSERLFSSNAPRAPGSNRSSRVVSGDMSRYGGDIVPEEPDDELVEASNRLVIVEDRPEDRPPLPTRKPSEQIQEHLPHFPQGQKVSEKSEAKT